MVGTIYVHIFKIVKLARSLKIKNVMQNKHKFFRNYYMS